MKTLRKLVVFLLLVVIVTAMIPLTVSASSTIAWGAANVAGTNVRIRSGPGLDHSILTHAGRGDIVVIIERTSDEWYKVNFNGTVGYISVPLLERVRDVANFNKRGSISGNGVNMRERPNTTSTVLGQHSTGTTMDIIGINKGWYKVVHNSVTGYIRSDLMTVTSGSSSSQSSTARSSSSSSSSPSSTPNANLTLGQQIADFGVSLVGHSYVRAGSSPSTGFDCSGFVTYVMRQHGISLTRSSAGMYRDNGVSVNRSDLVAGDLVFFAKDGRNVDHVGIYIGGSRFVHASSSRTGVIITNLDTRTIFGAKRVT